MLILTRRIGESVYIGDEVRMTVLGVRGTQVRIGINAPKEVPVHREEIYYRIKHENDDDVEMPEDVNGNYIESDYDNGQPHMEEGDPHNS